MTARRFALALGCLLLVAAVIGLAAHWPIPAVAWTATLGIICTVGILVERHHYKRLREAPPGPGWVLTDERFVDNATGGMVSVYYKPATGERLYVKA
jgi:hypothetical protein